MTTINQDPATSNTEVENTKNSRQNLDEEIKQFKIEVASLKKDHVAPAHAIPLWRQILPAPPTKQLPQKIIHDSNNNQVGSKNLQMLNVKWRPASK